MGRRRRARQFAVQMLYQHESGGSSLPEVVEAFRPVEVISEVEGDRVPDGAALEESLSYARRLVAGTEERLERIDSLIAESSTNWRVERLAAVDRAILRLAVYEMLFVPEVPNAVAIDEAIELAKRFGSEKSAAFVNGVLDGLLRREAFSASL